MTLHAHVTTFLGAEPAAQAILNGRIRVNSRKRRQCDSAVKAGDLVEWMHPEGAGGDLPIVLAVRDGGGL
jgi:hypothetical protein